MVTAEFICSELGIDYSQVLNIYPYGSKVYGTADEHSDDDYVIVYKTSFLPSGAFKDNDISSKDRKIQGTCYSRSGFIDAINNYQISALECIFLPEEKVIQKKMNFQMSKLDNKVMAKKIISLASSSWHFSTLAFRDNHYESCAKNIFHALRILEFGLQIKKHGRIQDYSSMNKTRKKIFSLPPDPKDYYKTFMKLSNAIKN